MPSVVKKMKCNPIMKNIHELSDELRRNLKNAELVHKNIVELDSGMIGLLVFECYYFRCGGYVSLTIMLTEKEDIQTADIIGSGGGEGISNISFGANSSFANKAIKILQNYGFTETH